MSGPLDVGSLISLLETTDIQSGQAVRELVLDNLRSNKEAWLVIGLVDSYVLSRSDQCLDILTAVSEPHDKHLFDRLLDHLKGPHKLAALTILATLVYKQPTWLHKLLTHGLFTQLLKCLKNDTDVPVLLSGLLIITALLPFVPVSINQYLPHIFDMFHRLASLCLKPPNNLPELYKYHLLVGVYSLHHRLYAMYPYHFLTYLRNVYSRQEHQEVFDRVIKPMIDKVRLHPLLFTTSRDKEVSRDRWRHKEVHDILVECAQFSLDLTEGSTTEMSVAGPQKMAEPFLMDPKGALAELMTPTPGSLLSSIDQATILKQQGSGVMTPPLGQDATIQQSSTVGTVRESSGSQQGAALISPIPETQKTPKSKKRLSQTSLSLAGKMPTPTDTPIYPDGSCSVPPSPLRPDFTNDPPFAAHRMQAIRKLSFHQSEPPSHLIEIGRTLEKALSGTDKLPRQPLKPATEAPAIEKESHDATEEGIPEADGITKPGVMPPSGESQDTSPDADTVPPGSQTSLQTELETAPSLTQLPKFLDSLDNQPEGDGEVSEITTFTLADDEDDDDPSEGSDTPSHLPANISTAASMADFMKKFNRLRFNSMNVSRDVPVAEKTIRSERSRSCPDLEPKNDETIKEESVKTITAEKAMSPLPKPSVVAPQSRISTAEKMTRVNSSQTSLFALSSALLEKTKKSPETRNESEASTETDGAMSAFEQFPYEELFSMSLPFSPYVQCYSCVMKDSAGKERPALDDQVPLFSSYSPVELLDRILDQGHLIHQQGRGYASPGGNTPTPVVSMSNDVSVLRGQIDMLHHQLMFERHKRELHAQRNRRLLSRIVKTVSLQEQNNAMKDQLQLQENELTTLRQELHQQQKHCQQLQQTTATHEADTERREKSYKQKLEMHQNTTKELRDHLEAAVADKVKANKEVQAYQAQVYTLTKEVELLTNKNQVTTDLQEQVKRLNKELLLMGELQQKYQSRLIALNSTDNTNAHTQFLLETYKGELNTVKNNLSQKTMESDCLRSRLEESLSEMKQKDDAIAELKQMVETARDTYREEIESVEDKYASIKKSHLALQTEFLTLHHQMSLAEQRASRPRGHGRVGGATHSPVDIDCGGAREHTSDNTSRHRDGVPDWSAPASISSVESAEEAVAMDTSSQ